MIFSLYTLVNRFQTCFPKTGGGEDVDFFVQVGQDLVAVPEASVEHPWWPGGRLSGYQHVFNWAMGDGHLIDLHPQLTYRRFPAALECGVLVLAGSLLSGVLFRWFCVGKKFVR